jgi:hypothetical protein
MSVTRSTSSAIPRTSRHAPTTPTVQAPIRAARPSRLAAPDARAP